MTTTSRLIINTDNTSKGCSSEGGLMITAPAKERTEALVLSNELMKASLQGANPLK